MQRVLALLPPSFETSAFAELARMTENVTDRTARYWLAELVEIGELRRHGKGHYTRLKDYDYRFPSLPFLPFAEDEDED
jgi:hypothetical protein